jgi:hypothetical protein
MSRYREWCPSCGVKIDPKTIPLLRSNSFSCPCCNAPLRIVPAHERMSVVVSIAMSLILPFFLGFRGLRFALVTVGSFFLWYLFISPFVVSLTDPARIRLRQPTDFQVRFPSGPRK